MLPERLHRAMGALPPARRGKFIAPARQMRAGDAEQAAVAQSAQLRCGTLVRLCVSNPYLPIERPSTETLR